MRKAVNGQWSMVRTGFLHSPPLTIDPDEVHEMSDERKREASKRTRGVIDRIEDDGMAVVLVGEEEGVSLDVPASLLPEGAEEGDHLSINIALDKESRRSAEDRVKALQEKLEKRGGSSEQKNFKL